VNGPANPTDPSGPAACPAAKVRVAYAIPIALDPWVAALVPAFTSALVLVLAARRFVPAMAGTIAGVVVVSSASALLPALEQSATILVGMQALAAAVHVTLIPIRVASTAATPAIPGMAMVTTATAPTFGRTVLLPPVAMAGGVMMANAS